MKILNDYAEGVNADLADLAKKFAKQGAKALREKSKEYGWGDNTNYDNGWSTWYEENRYSEQGIIYNAIPGLPHLLEHGHAKRGGGRTNAFPHIAPVEKEIVEGFTKAVEKKL